MTASTRHHPHPILTATRHRCRRHRPDQGQAALVGVVAITAIMVVTGGVLVQDTVATDPLMQSNLTSRYAYRALEAGLNSYLNTVNANPDLAACSTATNGTPQCGGLSYGTWSEVPDTGTSQAMPEYYLYGNPQPVIDPSDWSIDHVSVEIVGAAGYPGRFAYQSTEADLTPQNGFLDHIWWSNFEAINNSGSGDYASCSYDWQNSYNGPGGPCTAVYFGPNDIINGPVYTNDSMYVTSKPAFTSVQTADPNCWFVDPLDGTHGSPPGCASAVTADVASPTPTGSRAHAVEQPPADDSELATIAADNGCLYAGPTTVTLSGGRLTVTSPDTPVSAGVDTLNESSNTNTCPTAGGSASLPANGVVFVETATSHVVSGANPFDDTGHGGRYSQTTNTYTVTTGVGRLAQTTTYTCTGCYYGQSTTPDSEGDAFVSGDLSGHLTVATQNNIIVDGNITYDDCASWTGISQQSVCEYNPNNQSVAAESLQTNDSLGLIAYNYAEIDHPVDQETLTYTRGTLVPTGGTALQHCGTPGALSAPLCDPSSTSGNLTVDAAILALHESFVVNNYMVGGAEGQLTAYGSIQQFARGPVGVFSGSTIISGYSKYYTWDPRLELFAPPSYLQPGTQSWALASSSVNMTQACPQLPSPWQPSGTPTYSTCPAVP